MWDMKISLGFSCPGANFDGLFGDPCECQTRELLHPIEGGFQVTVLSSRGLVDGSRFGVEPDIDGLTSLFVSPLIVGAMTLGRVGMATTLRLAAFDLSGKNRTLGKIFQLSKGFVRRLPNKVYSVQNGKR